MSNVKNFKGITLLIFLFIGNFAVVLGGFAVNLPQRGDKKPTVLDDSNFKESAPILISSDKDFETYNFSGSGTIDDPYIIENLAIAESQYVGIFISKTTKYFVIQNNYISSI